MKRTWSRADVLELQRLLVEMPKRRQVDIAAELGRSVGSVAGAVGRYVYACHPLPEATPEWLAEMQRLNRDYEAARVRWRLLHPIIDQKSETRASA